MSTHTSTTIEDAVIDKLMGTPEFHELLDDMRREIGRILSDPEQLHQLRFHLYAPVYFDLVLWGGAIGRVMAWCLFIVWHNCLIRAAVCNMFSWRGEGVEEGEEWET